MTRTRASALFRNRNFRNLFAAQLISVAGSALSPVALTFAVLAATDSKGDLALVLAASTVPMVAALVFGGALVNRFGERRVAVVSNWTAAVSQIALALLFLTHSYALPTVMALQAVTGCAIAAYLPIVVVFTKASVPRAGIQTANAVLSMTRSMAKSLGPAAAGVLVVTVGGGWALLADGLSFAGAALLLARLPGPSPAEGGVVEDSAATFLAEVSRGFREVRSRPWVWSSIVAFTASNLATSVLLVLGPIVLVSRHGGQAQWGLVVSALGVGQIVGDGLSLWLRPQRPMLVARLVEVLSAGLLLALAWDAGLPVLVAAAIASGVATTFPDTLWSTALQQHLPGEALASVSAYDWMASLSLRPLGFVVGVAVADVVGVAAVFVAVAVILTVASISGLMVQEIRTMRGVVQEPSQGHA